MKDLGPAAEGKGVERSQAPSDAPTACRLCGGPAGPSEECPSCERKLSSYIAGLVEELRSSEEIPESQVALEELAAPPVSPSGAAPATPGPPSPPAPPSPPSPPEGRSPQAHARRRGPRRLLIATVAVGSLALASSLALSQGDPTPTPEPPRIAAEPPAPAPGPAPDAADPAASAPEPDPPRQQSGPVRFGDWSGEARVLYEDGTRDAFTISFRVGAVEPGKVVGTAVTTQGETTCRGSLTSLGRVDGVFRFAYRESNTAECVASSRIWLTPRGDHRLAYKEVTDLSVNRGTLTRD